MKPLKEKVSITLDEDLVAHIRVLAEQDDRSFSQYINKVLKDYVAKQQANARQPEAH
ncbi:MAG: ribbon-helix-helix protein, CopG family [Clostridia bacterium]|nr:ribbon-helix-helix protein, CopG family [Clostridia bacterium]